MEKKEKRRFDYFFMICLTTILGYFGKYSLNFMLIYRENKKYENQSNDNNYINNQTDIFENLNEKEISFFKNVFGLYFACIMISIFLYSIFVCIFTKNQKNTKKGNVYRICQICGYTIYSENIILNDDIPKCECIKLCCKSFKNCCDKAVCAICLCTDEGEEEEEDIDCCCCCCCDYNEEEYDKNKEFFCYCYQAKRKSNWFNKFISNDIQKKIIPYMIEYFLLQLTTIGFERQYELFNSETNNNKTTNNNGTNTTYETKYNSNFIYSINFINFVDNYTNKINNKYDLNENIIFLIIFIATFIVFIYLTISFSKLMQFCCEKKNNKNERISRLSNEILDGTHGILFFNAIVSLIFSSFELSQREDFINIIEKTVNYIYIPILMNKFYYFTLTYYCISYSEDKKGFELISGSTLISIYIMIWELILNFIREFFDRDNIKILYIIQIVFSSIPSLIVGILIIISIFYSIYDCSFFKLLFCFLSFLICGGGLWFKMEGKDCDCEECCYNFCECCEICGDCFGCSCIGTTCFCECCCCDSLSSCYSEFCYEHCYGIDICCGICDCCC